ncbi:hypothetical protein UA08_07268 [Talaromyces atroroseus]|uniref:Uncharacterized protein n=1 Tax=Talaromyces atroroseus TaxID=1441469 RepID=A0A225AWC5_TALAT|nr:hypothetical protein UA08_07268 [Talaromyces atroroseus]OKL57797.1 hypothetical protein UA08_07268 [Talaromyces atroroseus]
MLLCSARSGTHLSYNPSSAQLDDFYANFKAGSNMLQALLHLSSTDDEVQELIWISVTVFPRPISIAKLRAFSAELTEWKGLLGTILLKYDVDFPLSEPQNLTWQMLHQLPIPPLPYSGIPMQLRLILSLYTFYVARTKWAMSSLSDDDDDDDGNPKFELETYFYFYQQLRLASTDLSSAKGNNNNTPEIDEQYHACESVKIGFSPLLYLAGHSCYRIPSWMEWVAHKLSQIGQEGLFNSQIYTMTLEALLHFEKLPSAANGAEMMHFATDRCKRRVSSLLIPCCNRRAYVAYYLYSYIRSDDSDHKNKSSKHSSSGGRGYDTIWEESGYFVSGKTRWGDSGGSGSCSHMSMVICDANETVNGPVTMRWLFNQPIFTHWAEWSFDQEFRLDRVLTDHIVGGSFDRTSEYRYEVCTVY